MAGGGLGGQHHRVAAVENGIGDIVGLGAGRTRVVDHRLEHLRGGDHRLARVIALLDQGFLHDRHVLRRGLHTQVAARHHDCIGHGNDGVDVAKGFRLLDLGDDRNLAAMRGQHDVDQLLDIAGLTHEGQRHIIQAVIIGELQIAPILVGDRGNVQLDIGQIDALARLEATAVDHPGRNLVALDALHGQLEQAIIDENPITGLDLLVQAAMVNRHLLHPIVNPADQFIGTQHQGFAGRHVQRIAFELAETDLRSLQILKNGDMPVQVLGGLTHQPHRLRVIIEAAVGKIEPDHVRAFPQQALDRLGVAGIRSQGRYDLGEFHRFCHACSRSWPNSLKNQTNQTVIFIFSSASVTVHTADDHFPVARRQSAPAGLK